MSEFTQRTRSQSSARQNGPASHDDASERATRAQGAELVDNRAEAKHLAQLQAAIHGRAGGAPVQLAAGPEEEIPQMKAAPAQLAAGPEEEVPQMKAATAQLAAGPEEEIPQMKAATAQRKEPEAKRPNNTGIPDHLKANVEDMSGVSLDEAKVHYNSSQPAQLNALAYAQGKDIHVAPGQEKHLAHETWHLVQQAQGRVAPTTQLKEGVPINDDSALEQEADVMGARAAQAKAR